MGAECIAHCFTLLTRIVIGGIPYLHCSTPRIEWRQSTDHEHNVTWTPLITEYDSARSSWENLNGIARD